MIWTGISQRYLYYADRQGVVALQVTTKPSKGIIPGPLRKKPVMSKIGEQVLRRKPGNIKILKLMQTDNEMWLGLPAECCRWMPR